MDNKVLFTTEDGFEITGKDKYFSVKIREYPQHPLFKGKTPVPLYFTKSENIDKLFKELNPE